MPRTNLPPLRDHLAHEHQPAADNNVGIVELRASYERAVGGSKASRDLPQRNLVRAQELPPLFPAHGELVKRRLTEASQTLGNGPLRGLRVQRLLVGEQGFPLSRRQSRRGR